MNLTKYLCCPVCKSNLDEKGGSLLCRRCNYTYEIKEGIPILVHREDFSRQYRKEVNYFTNYKDFKIKDYKLEEWHKSFLRRFKENFPDLKDKIILDCGVGQGYMTIELARQGAFLLACDLTFKCLERLKHVALKNNLADRILFVCCSAESLPIKSKKVDCFILSAVLEHLEREERAIGEINRVCKNKSGLMVTVPLQYYYLNPLLIPFCLFQDKIIGHLRRYDKEKLLEKLSGFKWKAERVYYSGHFLKVLITKFFTEPFGFTNLARIGENWDKKRENKKHGASNICVLLKRG